MNAQVEKVAPTLDQLTDEIVAISAAMKKLRATRLTDDTLYLLIQNAIGQNSSTRYKKVPLKTIKIVIEGIEALESTCLKKKGPTK